MKVLKSIRLYIVSKVNNLALTRVLGLQLLTDSIITELYKKVAKRQLQIDTKIIEVKKGKIRYTLVIIKDHNLKTVYNLGRHFEARPYIKSSN